MPVHDWPALVAILLRRRKCTRPRAKLIMRLRRNRSRRIQVSHQVPYRP